MYDSINDIALSVTISSAHRHASAKEKGSQE